MVYIIKVLVLTVCPFDRRAVGTVPSQRHPDRRVVRDCGSSVLFFVITVILNLSTLNDNGNDVPVLESLGESEVCDFEMALSIEQQVFWFEIAVDKTK